MPVTLPVRFRLCDEKQEDNYLGGWALDISVGGMLLRCDATVRSMGIGTELHVQFPVSTAWVSATGKVVWTQPSPSVSSQLLGICFVDFNDEDRDMFQRFMESGPST